MRRAAIDAVVSSLRDLKQRGGRAAIGDERRVRGKLLDARDVDAATLGVVIGALRLGAPERLAGADTALLPSVLRRETERLRKQLGVEHGLAAEVMGAWTAIVIGRSAPPPPPPPRPLFPIIAVVALAAIAAVGGWLWFRAPVPVVSDPKDPLYWPLEDGSGGRYAVLLPPSSPACRASAGRTGCIRSTLDLGTVTGRDGSIPAQALFFQVVPKAGSGCGSRATYSSETHCLTEVPLPWEKSVKISRRPDNPFSDCATVVLNKISYCVATPVSPALRGPWVETSSPSVFFAPAAVPDTLTWSRDPDPSRSCPPGSLLQNLLGFCLSP